MTAYKKTDIKRSTFCIFFALFPRTIINTESIEKVINEAKEKAGVKEIAKENVSDIMNVSKEEKLAQYIGKPIVKTDNQSIREWYYANAGNIPNVIDKTQPLEEQVKQAFELRNQYKHEARIAMSDRETAEMLEKKRPAKTFEELVADKMKRKEMSREEALKDILETASKTNADVNKEFGLWGEGYVWL